MQAPAAQGPAVCLDDVEIDVAIAAGEWPDVETLLALGKRAFAAARAEASLTFLPGSELSLVFTDDDAMKALNRAWRGMDKPTNVLSFPAGDGESETFGPLLGDVVLASQTVEREAKAFKRPLRDHICHLIVHGILHLFGYDHQTDEEAGSMETLETRILAALGIADPYA